MTSLICAATIMINLTSHPWDSRDAKVIKRAKYVCKTYPKYIGNRCLSKFIKSKKRSYYVICGPKRSKQ